MTSTVKAQTQSLLLQYQSSPDHLKGGLESDILKLNKALVISLVKKLNPPRNRWEDFVQEADHGMLCAIRRFDPTRGIQFSTYAVNTISGVLKNAYRDKEWFMSVSRTEKEKGLKLISTDSDNLAELQAKDPVEFERILQLSNALNPLELSPIAMARLETSSNGSLSEDDSEEDQNNVGDMVTMILETFSEEEGLIISHHFFDGFSPEELGVAFLMPTDDVRQIINAGLDRARKSLNFCVEA